MTKTIRTPTKAEGGITPEEKEKMDKITEKYIKNAFQTGRTNQEKLTKAIKTLYKFSGLEEPRVVVVPSPLVMAMAYGFASGIWHLRKNVATRDATRVATADATRDATDDATFNATADATRVATRVATADATRDATRDATDDATFNATADATYDATDVVTSFKSIALKFVEEKHVNFLFECVKRWTSVYQGGNMWSGWLAYAEAMRDVIGLTGLDCWDKYQAWEDCGKLGGFRVMHEKFCIVSDFPDFIKTNEQNQPHCIDGASHRWSDGFEIYYLNGINFDKDLYWKVVKKELSFEDILKLKNVDQRTQAMRFANPFEFVKHAGGVHLDYVEKRGKKDNRLIRYFLFKVPQGEMFAEDAYFAIYDDSMLGVAEQHMHGVIATNSIAEAMAWKRNGGLTAEQWLALELDEDFT